MTAFILKGGQGHPISHGCVDTSILFIFTLGFILISCVLLEIIAKNHNSIDKPLISVFPSTKLHIIDKTGHKTTNQRIVIDKLQTGVFPTTKPLISVFPSTNYKSANFHRQNHKSAKNQRQRQNHISAYFHLQNH